MYQYVYYGVVSYSDCNLDNLENVPFLIIVISLYWRLLEGGRGREGERGRGREGGRKEGGGRERENILIIIKIVKFFTAFYISHCG